MKIQIDTQKRTKEIFDLFGIFFEDLNHAADGGLYAQLVQNPNFEFLPIDRWDYHNLYAWEKIGGDDAVAIEVLKDNPPIPQNPHYVKITGKRGTGIRNLGYAGGMVIDKSDTYDIFFYAKGNTRVKVALEGQNKNPLCEKVFEITSDWKKYTHKFSPHTSCDSATLAVYLEDDGEACLDAVYLFPNDTFEGLPIRKDLAQALLELKPKFMRFPGGCLVHDGSLEDTARDSMYRWKNTIVPVEFRPARRNNWQYNQTLGLGFYEYFVLSEKIGAKPLPVLPAAYNPHRMLALPLDQLKPYIDDCLDLIEFANGDTSTPWGRKRAELGHPEPFNLEYIAIGNEEVGDEFFERYAYFHKAIKEKYPEIKIINSSGPFNSGSEYEKGYKSAYENGSDLIDEHYYCSPTWFLANMHRYDNFDPNGPKVFLGEYASWGNEVYNAVVEAAYMTHLQNAPVVALACYAPLFCNVNYINWQPDLIWFDKNRVVKTANYYVQKLFSVFQGDYVADVKKEGFETPPPKEENIAGKIIFISDDTEVSISNITVIDEENQKIYAFEDFSLERREQKELFYIDSKKYKLKFHLVKRGGNKFKGLIVNFGYKDDHNRHYWEIGGWQNQDLAVSHRVEGKSTTLTESRFILEENRQYSLCLEVEGRTIKGHVDGELMNNIEDKLPVIEPLYVTASVKDDEAYLKVVNVTEKAQKAEIEFLREKALSGMVHKIAGYDKFDKNTFDEPDKVKIKSNEFKHSQNRFTYEFEPLSVTVFAFKINNGNGGTS